MFSAVTLALFRGDEMMISKLSQSILAFFQACIA